MASSSSRSRHAILGVLAFGPATGYQVRKLLSETTAHFWKESYGQIYPALEELLQERLIEVVSHETTGRETKRYGIRPDGEQALRAWIRSPEVQLKPGRNELLLKLFFSREDDAPWLLPQIEAYAAIARELLATYASFGDEADQEDMPADARRMIGTTIDFGVAAAEMQLAWCSRTAQTLREMSRDG